MQVVDKGFTLWRICWYDIILKAWKLTGAGVIDRTDSCRTHNGCAEAEVHILRNIVPISLILFNTIGANCPRYRGQSSI